LLKRYLASKHIACLHLPEVLEDGQMTPKPQVVLETKTKNKKTKFLIQWQGLSPTKAMWPGRSGYGPCSIS
jgi:hypothetical protein